MSVTASILIVDDEPAIVDLLRFMVDKAGWNSAIARNGAEAWEQIQSRQHSLVLLDWMMPDISGFHLLTRIRANRSTDQLPVIMLTARGMEEDRIAALDNGADDYVTKPFSLGELTSRIHALLRRGASSDRQELLRAGPVVLDSARVTVMADGEKLEMGHAEFKLLKFFLTHPDRVFSRSQLLKQVWGGHAVIEERTVDVHMLRLRKALRQQEHLIRTVRGAGYMLSER